MSKKILFVGTLFLCCMCIIFAIQIKGLQKLFARGGRGDLINVEETTSQPVGTVLGTLNIKRFNIGIGKLQQTAKIGLHLKSMLE
jgi:hypothetical protein